MEKHGKAFARTYWFDDDEKTIYFDWLSVIEKERKRGFGTELLESHIKAAKTYNLESLLWVKKETWMHDWYKRKGYIDYQDYLEEKNSVWMKLIY